MEGKTPTFMEDELLEICKARELDMLNARAKQTLDFLQYCKLNCYNGKIVLNQCGLGPTSAKTLAKLVLRNQCIHHLELRENNLGEAGIDEIVTILKTSKHLVHLDVSANQLTSSAMDKLITSLKTNVSLYCLTISNTSGPHQNHIKSDGFIKAPLALLQNRTLGILDVSGNMLGNEGLSYLAKGLYKNKSLLWLNISQVYIDKGSVEHVSRILRNSRITHLDISKNKLGNEFLEKFGQNLKAHFCFLKHLNCSYCEFMDPECSRFFCSLERLSIHTLIFDGNLVGDTDANKFAESIENVWSIRTLNLNNCRIGCNGAVAIAQKLLRQGPQLSSISLQSNRIMDTGAIELAINLASEKCNLKSVDLSRNLIGDRGGIALANALLKSTKLRKLNISWNYVGEPTGKALEFAFLRLRRDVVVLFDHNKIFSQQQNKLTRIMEAVRVKRDKEELKRKEEEVVRISTSLGSYHEVVREIEGISKLLKEAQEVYDEEYAEFDQHQTKFEEGLQVKSGILLRINVRQERINEEMTNVTKKRIQAVEEFHTVLNEMHRKMGHLTEYLNRIKAEGTECKEKANRKRNEYEKECLVLKKQLDAEKEALHKVLYKNRALEKILGSLRLKADRESFARMADKMLGIEVDSEDTK